MKRLLFALALAGHGFLVAAAPVEAGSIWPGLSLPDQHDKTVSLGGEHLRTVVFAAERKPGDLAQDVIDKSFKNAALAGRLVLVFDVSRMPAFVTRMFAIPSFRERTFPVLVARDSVAVDFLPRKEGHVAILTIDSGKVATIDFAGDAATLEQLLRKLLP
jgi:hypothetical protein